MPTAHHPAPVVLVTGAASPVGVATCRAFLDAGMSVVGVDLTPAYEDRPLLEHPAYTHVLADDTERDQLADAAAEAAAHGPLRHVVALAGGVQDAELAAGDPLSVTPEQFLGSVRANLLAAYVTAQVALPYLRDELGDRTLTFRAAVNAVPGAQPYAYSAAQAGLNMLVRSLATTEGPGGVRINAASTALGSPASDEDAAATYLAVATQLTALTGRTVTVAA